jgi:curved DNA-binding protein CbpA
VAARGDEQVAVDATPAEIKARFYEKAKMLHPDLNTAMTQEQAKVRMYKPESRARRCRLFAW